MRPPDEASLGAPLHPEYRRRALSSCAALLPCPCSFPVCATSPSLFSLAILDAFPAALSAISFPGIPACPRTQCSVSRTFLRSFRIFFVVACASFFHIGLEAPSPVHVADACTGPSPRTQRLRSPLLSSLAPRRLRQHRPPPSSLPFPLCYCLLAREG